MTDKCPEYIENLYAYIDGELTPARYQELKQHLEDCPPCLTEYERDILLKRLIKRACTCESAPEELRATIMTRISYSYSEIRYHEG